MSFGRNLASLRERDGKRLSQDDVSQALGMTRPAYKQLETGEREPTMAELKAISELFGVRVEVLTGSSPINDKDVLSDGVESGVDKIKYKNLVLYLAGTIGAKPNVGETVFYKLIYFIETLAFQKNGKGIVGERFFKMQYGPVPASFQSITREMLNNNELDRVQGRYFTYMQTKYLPRVEATGLTHEEKEIIDTIIDRLGDESATYLSDLSHEDRPWVDAQDGDYVDLALIKDTELDASKKMGRFA